MSSDKSAPALPSRWQIVFILRGLPKKYCLHASDFIVCTVAPKNAKELIEAIGSFAQGKFFAAGISDTTPLNLAAFQVEETSDKAALEKAAHHLDAIIDGFGILFDTHIIKICTLALVRKDDQPHHILYHFLRTGKVHWGANIPDFVKIVDDYKDQLSKHVLTIIKLLRYAISEGCETDLDKQIVFSMATFRRSENPHFLGLEFLGKFAALEGLVCGNSREGKKQTLDKRLGQLFKHDMEIAQIINEVWQMRSKAVHQAQFHYDEQINEGQILSTELSRVHYLFVGCLVFALESMNSVKTVDELWKLAGSYTLPDWAQKPNPEVARSAYLTSMCSSLKIKIEGLAEDLDDFLKANA